MSIPNEDAALGAFPEVEETASEKTTTNSNSFEEQVNAAVSKMKQGDNGLWIVPDNLPDHIAFAAKLEKRRRDTQSALAKTQQELKAAKAVADSLKTKVVEKSTLNLTVQEAEELEDLKISNPEAWRKKLADYEDRASKTLAEELSSIDLDASVQSELERRHQVLTEFLETNPDLVLNDEVFANDLPPRITGKLERGEVSFEDFLEEAKEFLTNGKVIKGTRETDAEPNLGKAGGRSTAADSAVESDFEQSYKNVIF